MAYAHIVPGAAEIKVGTGSAGALEGLGYTDRGVEMRFQAYTLDVPCDDHGGEHGAPSDIQHFGYQKATVRMTLTKWDDTISDKIDGFIKGLTPGATGTVGELIFANQKYFRLAVASTVDPHNFPCAVLAKEPREIPIHGSRYQAKSYTFECYADPISSSSTYGVLFNATVS